MKKEILGALGAFFGVAGVVVIPFRILYDDSWPRADDGGSLSAREALFRDPVVLVVLVVGTLLAAVAADAAHRWIRPRSVRTETAADVSGAAREAGRALATIGSDPNALAGAAASYLVNLKRQWPYEPGRVWVRVTGVGVEVVAERSFQKAQGLLWHWADRQRVRRMDARGWAGAGADGTVTGHTAQVFEPPGPAS